MLHITQCIFDELFVKVLSDTSLRGPHKKFYRISTAMMNIVTYEFDKYL